MSKPLLLIVEDDPGLCTQYRWAFPDYRVMIANDRRQAEIVAKRDQPAFALLDLGLPPDPEGVSEGFAAFEGLRRACPDLMIVVVTGMGQRENALRAIALGAFDFCEKPIDLPLLQTLLDRALRVRDWEEENRRMAALPRSSTIPGIITSDDAMLKVCRSVERLASVSVPVLLLGESGTGKEAMARALHDLGPRAGRPFVALNCAAIPEALLESELFGHERGAFTGAVRQVTGRIEGANGGTLFLDEIGDLPGSLQAKLLRVLQDQVIERVGGRAPIKVDVRLVSATNQPLEEHVAADRFRGDLLHRLNAVTVRLPPLRDRGTDLLLLARWFLARFSQEYGRRMRGLDPQAAAAIAAHTWPGNIRELENRIRRAALMGESTLVSVSDLELQDVVARKPAASPQPIAPPAEQATDLRLVRGNAERKAVDLALARSKGSMSRAANLLGVSRPTLYALLHTHGMAIPRRSAPNDDSAS